MKSIPVSCSDERAALARRGTLTASEWQDFATHLTTCIDCRMAWRLAADFDQSAPARAGDERMIARAVNLALTPAARKRGTMVRIAIAAAVTLVAAGVASGAMVLRARFAEPGGGLAMNENAAHPRSRGVGGLRAASVVSTPAPVAPAAEFPAQVSDDSVPFAVPLAVPLTGPTVVPAPEPARVSRPGAKPNARLPQRVASVEPVVDPASPLLSPPSQRDDAPGLFAQAMVERQEGRSQLATAGFRALQRRYPDSQEATVSLVSLGDLLFGAGNRAEALLAFEAYLVRAPSGTLAHEALVGKARALEALGRTTEAGSTWRTVAHQFPHSPYAQRALGAGIGGTSP